MAIDFPPAIPAEQSNAEQLSEYVASAPSGAAISTNLKNGARVEITGNRHLDRTAIVRIVEATASVELAANALSIAHHDAGHLLTRVFYSEGQPAANIHIVNARLTDLDAPETLQPYFTALINDPHLTAAEFEQRRLPAVVHTDYAGSNYRVSYRAQENPGDLTLVLSPRSTEADDGPELSVALNNEGNRFLGRYFGTLNLEKGFEHGGAIDIFVNSLIEQFGDSGDGKRYSAGGAGYALARPHGLYRVQVAREQYTRSVTVASDGSATLTGIPLVDALVVTDNPTGSDRIDLNATINHYGVESEQLWYADRRSRFSTIARVKRSDNRIENDSDEPIIDESSTSLEIGAIYTMESGQLRLVTSAFADFGIAGEFDTAAANDGILNRNVYYDILRPRVAVDYSLSDDSSLRLDVSAQLTDDAVTEHQQYVLGGPDRLAAWLPGVVVGDSGYYTRLSATFAGLQLWGGTLPVEVFVEAGGAEFEGDGSSAGQQYELADAGIRVTLSHPAGFNSRFVAAKSLGSSDIDSSRSSLFEADFFWSVSYAF